MDLTHPIGQWLANDYMGEWNFKGPTLFRGNDKAAICYDCDGEKVCIVSTRIERLLRDYLKDIRVSVVDSTEFDFIARLFDAKREFQKEGFAALSSSSIYSAIFTGLGSLRDSFCPMPAAMAHALAMSQEFEDHKLVIALLALSDVIPARHTNVVVFSRHDGQLPTLAVERLEGSVQVVHRNTTNIVMLFSHEDDAIAIKLKYPGVSVCRLRPS